MTIHDFEPYNHVDFTQQQRFFSTSLCGIYMDITALFITDNNIMERRVILRKAKIIPVYTIWN